MKQETLFAETTEAPKSQTVRMKLIEGPLVGDDAQADLIASVKRLGILIPVLLQETPGPVATRFTVVDGRRRLKAAALAGLTEVPARILAADVANPEAYTLQANFTRRANPASEYVAIRDLMAKGYTEQEIGRTLGIKRATIRQRMALGTLIPVLYDLCETGRISVSVCEAAAKLPESIQEELLETFAANNDKLTMNDVRATKEVRRNSASLALSDVLFSDSAQKALIDKETALSHLTAAETLIKGLGLEVSFDTIKQELNDRIR